MGVKRDPAWVGAMRKGLRGQNGEGWTVRDVRGRIQLSVRFEDGTPSLAWKMVPSLLIWPSRSGSPTRISR